MEDARSLPVGETEVGSGAIIPHHAYLKISAERIGGRISRPDCGMEPAHEGANRGLKFRSSQGDDGIGLRILHPFVRHAKAREGISKGEDRGFRVKG
jgi:hypothetical protein